MQLFDLVNNKLTFSPQALALKPFKDLWDRDTTEDKGVAVQQLSFVWYYSDFKSDFSDLMDDEQRRSEIEKVTGCKADEKVMEACRFYMKMRETLITDSLLAAKEALYKVKEFFRTVDFEKTHPKTGQPIYKVKEVMIAVQDLAGMIQGLELLEQRVKKEKEESGRMKGSKEKKIFEDGI